MSDVGGLRASAKAPEKSAARGASRSGGAARRDQASRARVGGAPSPSPSVPWAARRARAPDAMSHISASNANADLKKSIGQLRAERDGAFGERDAS